MINNLRNKNKKYELIKNINNINYFENIFSLNAENIKFNNSLEMFEWDLKILKKMVNNKFSFFSVAPNKDNNKYKNIIYIILEKEANIQDNMLQLLRDQITLLKNVYIYTNSLQIINLFFKENILTTFIKFKGSLKNEKDHIWETLKENFNSKGNLFNAYLWFLRSELQDIFKFQMYPSNNYAEILMEHEDKKNNDNISPKIMDKLLSSNIVSWRENIKIFELEFSKYIIDSLIDILFTKRKIETLKNSIAINQDSRKKIDQYIEKNSVKIKKLKYQL